MCTTSSVGPHPTFNSSFEQQNSSSTNDDSSSIWGRIVSIPSLIFNFFKAAWNEHKSGLVPIFERGVQAIGTGVVAGFLTSIFTGAPLIMIGLGAAAGVGYIIASVIAERKMLQTQSL